MKTLSIEFVLTPDQKKELVEILRAKRSGVEARPRCVIWRCEYAELHWINKGDSIQTENGHFTASLDHWICPRCGGGYGTTPKPIHIES